MADTLLQNLDELVSPALTDVMYMVADPAGTPTDHKVQLSTVLDRGIPVFNAIAFGAVANGVADDSSAVQSAINAAAAEGGTVFFPAGTYRINSQLTIPNNAEAVPAQKPVRLTGVGALFSGRGSAPYGGSILDLRYSGTGAKLETYGLGLLEIDHLLLTDGANDSSPYIKTTNTTLMFHHNGVYGNKSGVADQDVLILGGLTTNHDGTADAPFQGYGTVIESNYFARINRGVLFQTFANGVVVRDNTWWSTCGGSAAIEMLPADESYCTGNVIANNLIECGNYTYGIKMTTAEGNSLIANNMFDPGTVTAYIRAESTAIYNLIIAGFGETTKPHLSAANTTNTFIAAAQSEHSAFTQNVDFSNFVTFKAQDVTAASPLACIPETSQSTSYIPFRIIRSAAEINDPSTAIFQVQYNGALAIGGAYAGDIEVRNQAGTAIAQFRGNLKHWELVGVGGSMSQDSGTGGSYFDMKNYAARFFDHNGGPLRLRIGAGSDGMQFGADLDTNLYRSAANELKTDDRFLAAAGLVTNSGVTGSRPGSPVAGQMYFDTTLGIPIWYSGAAWVNAAGAGV